MERLTARSKRGYAYYPHCFRKDTCNGEGGGNCGDCDFDKKICETIAAYEETGLTPEQLKQIDAAYTQQAKELAECKRKLEEM